LRELDYLLLVPANRELVDASGELLGSDLVGVLEYATLSERPDHAYTHKATKQMKSLVKTKPMTSGSERSNTR
jgi:hypothetical protein